jgi:hypothetical protein
MRFWRYIKKLIFKNLHREPSEASSAKPNAGEAQSCTEKRMGEELNRRRGENRLSPIIHNTFFRS